MRAWQFARGLASAGHTVRLLCMEMPGCYDGLELRPWEVHDGIEIERLREGAFDDPLQIRARILGFRPDALVGATIYGSSALARVPTDLPFWADQFGHVMAEAQAKAALDKRNDVLPYFWRMVKRVALRADRFSAVSTRQRFALIGELGAIGRLNAETCGYDFVTTLPCAVVPELVSTSSEPDASARVFPENSFVVLWSGSYNVWSDVGTLFNGLELAMKEDTRIRFLSTGGAIPGHDERTYRELLERISHSRYRDRFRMEGWVSASSVAGYWNQADVGVLTEYPIYEGMLGSKNRVIQWIASGLPVLYNKIGDLGEFMEREEVGLVFEAGDAEGFAEKIIWASRNPRELAQMAEVGRTFVLREFSAEQTTMALSEWAESPTTAPDRPILERGLRDPDDYSSFLREASRRASELTGLRGSKRLRSLRRWLLRHRLVP